MKINKTLLSSAFIIMLFATTLKSFSQQLKTPAPSPLQTLDQAFGLSNIKIEYSRPGVKNRVIFGDLVPYDKVWRTGANSSTKITFGDDVTVEGKALKSGTYALYTVPGKSSWDIIFYKDLDLGGDVANYKTENEVLRVKVQPASLAEKIETFTMNVGDITANTANIEIMWDKTKVTCKVATSIDEKIMKNIETALEKDSRPYYSAANYYYENNKDLNTALKWVNSAIEANPKAYYMVHLKAKIQRKLNDKKGALETAQHSLDLAKEAKNDDYVRLNEKLIAEVKAEK
jgi:tetratricopeptide (TPR) repeat protein